ncbi:MAG: DUF58 domain-containing protein [Legionella sp.]|nr:DUF58 domain-containing protein [Legionella sp.]
MTDGVTAELNELIELRGSAQSLQYHSKGRALPSGNHLSKVRGRGMDFSEVRHYQAGDEIRHMEWRVTARTGRPHVKIYEEAKERPVVILADFNPSMMFGTRVAFKSVIAARLASLIAWTTIKHGDRVGGFFFSAIEHHEFVPRGRASGVLPLLACLSHFTKQIHSQETASPRSFSDVLIRLHRVVRPGSILILISDFYSMDNDCEKHLHRLRAHNDILAFRVCDPLELSAPKPQQYPITNGREELVLDTSNGTVNKAYEHYCQQRTKQLQEQFKSLQIQYNQVNGQTNLSHLVRQIFPGRRRG